MKIALDAARGLAYLHEDSQPCVIHRDFKASNILLENDFHAKVSDFGLAKQAPEGRANYLSTRVMGTFGYSSFLLFLPHISGSSHSVNIRNRRHPSLHPSYPPTYTHRNTQTDACLQRHMHPQTHMRKHVCVHSHTCAVARTLTHASTHAWACMRSHMCTEAQKHTFNKGTKMHACACTHIFMVFLSLVCDCMSCDIRKPACNAACMLYMHLHVHMVC